MSTSLADLRVIAEAQRRGTVAALIVRRGHEPRPAELAAADVKVEEIIVATPDDEEHAREIAAQLRRCGALVLDRYSRLGRGLRSLLGATSPAGALLCVLARRVLAAPLLAPPQAPPRGCTLDEVRARWPELAVPCAERARPCALHRR